MATITVIGASDVIANSRADLNTNFSNLNSDKIETSVIDIDSALAANSDAKLPSQKAVKAYVDTLGNVNASETARGIVEEATDAEVTAGTATGSTGAKLFVSPAKLAALSAPVVRTYLNAGSPATWTKPSGLKYVIVEVQAGGGAGGTAGAASAGTGGAGGGGAGGYSRKKILAATLGATETVTTGAATASSSFGAHATATGGANGVDSSGGAGTAGGASGVGSSGDVNIQGQGGSPGAFATNGQLGGTGGSSVLGGGGAGASVNAAGTNGGNYGAGGGGGAKTGNPDKAGGTGAPGIVIVTEYYV